jgi:hypothetical protein
MARKSPIADALQTGLPPHIQCAHATCGQSAMCRIQTPTGWAKLCLYHYEAHFGEQGRQSLEKYGLVQWSNESKEEFCKRIREYCALLAKKVFKPMAHAGRVN